jgi:hypothetical protein
VNSDLANVFLLSLIAMANPTLFAATTLMLLLPNAKRLMLGYLLGAYTTSLISGVLIVLWLKNSGVVKTSKKTISPAEDVTVGVIALAVAFVLHTGRDAAFRERRQRRKAAKHTAENAKEPWSHRLLARGSARATFLAGAVLSFPGVAYLDALTHIVKLNPGPVPSLLLVVYFCLFQQILLELPLLGFAFAPEWTERAVSNFRSWVDKHGRGFSVILTTVLGVLLIARGLITLLS